MLCYATGAVVRLIDLFKVNKDFGIAYLVFLAMFADVVGWFKLVALITLGFGIGFTVLMPATTYGPIFARPFFRGMWGLLGDFDLDSVYENYDHDDLGSIIMPAMLFVYMFVVTARPARVELARPACRRLTQFRMVQIILVNLLIAQMSARYEECMAEGERLQLAAQIRLFKEMKDDRGSLPPPLNLLFLVTRDLPWLFARLRDCCLRRPKPASSAAAVRGWKVEVRGRAIEQARKLTCELRDECVKDIHAANAEQAQARTRAEKMEAKLDNLNAHFAREFAELEDRVNKNFGLLFDRLDLISPQTKGQLASKAMKAILPHGSSARLPVPVTKKDKDDLGDFLDPRKK
jgi:hypothetical protein